MDAATGLQPVRNHPTIGERGHRQRGDRETFRRALQQQGETAAEEAAAETPMRPQLQPPGPIDRREDGRRHVDVLA
jgi:hypothetical protein